MNSSIVRFNHYYYPLSVKAMAPHSSLLAWKIHGRRSLVGCGPRGWEQSDRTERLHFHFSLSCIGEGNGNPLQCSCLENPRDGGAWWAAVYGVAQSRTRLKRFSSSSSSIILFNAKYIEENLLFPDMLFSFTQDYCNYKRNNYINFSNHLERIFYEREKQNM